MNDYSVDKIKARVEDVALAIAKEFSLPFKSVEFIKTDQFYGQCDLAGNLKIKIEYWDGELVPEMEVWRTLGHELAHLKHPNHGDDFWVYNRDLVNRISEIIGKKIRPEVAFTQRRGVIY